MPAAPDSALLLLAELPPGVQPLADRVRADLAPMAAMRMAAHCALFRHLPGPSLPILAADLRAVVRQQPAPLARIGAPVLKDRMLALPVRSPELLDLRAQLAHLWAPMLLPQERGAPRLHITLASGLAKGQAQAALERAQAALGNAAFIDRPVAVSALCLVAHGTPVDAPLLRAAFPG